MFNGSFIRFDIKNNVYSHLCVVCILLNQNNFLSRESLARRLEEYARKQAEPSPEPIEETIDEEPVKYLKPWEHVKQKTLIAEDKPHETRNRQRTLVMDDHRPKTNFVRIHGHAGLQSKPADGDGTQADHDAINGQLHLPPIGDRLNTPEKTKLENMSRDIITGENRFIIKK